MANEGGPSITPLIGGFQRIKTSSVLAPLLVLALIVGAVALLATPFLSNFPALIVLLWSVFIALVAFTVGVYFYWTTKNPSRLQSEDYQLEHQRLGLIGDERDPKMITITASSITSNTASQRALNE